MATSDTDPFQRLSDEFIACPRSGLVRVFRRRGLQNILAMQASLQADEDFDSNDTDTERRYERDEKIERYYRAISDFVQMQRLSIPLALDMTYLDARLGSMSESELAGRWKAPWANLDPLEHRAILLPESICWSDRVAPDLAQRIESWKQSRLFQKIARATKLFHTTPDSTEEELFFDNDRYAEIILHVLVFFLPVFFFASMVVLSAIQKLIYRLVAIMLFTLVFAGIVVRFSRAGPFELFASTVA
ncbi:hypothetical protein BJX68DRAFT_269413 [Aspergillus pseudodeflectus]|uniref:DUF6594 domain-containing protein n=1 Tax=Aspergillus pseudodeflectus TaxID=176178 RepID=A0ABR4JY14_9EURO